MLLPDCLGYRLNIASQMLKDCGAAFVVKNASPFYKGLPKEDPKLQDGELYVIAQKTEGDLCVLTVCAVPKEGDEHDGK